MCTTLFVAVLLRTTGACLQKYKLPAFKRCCIAQNHNSVHFGLSLWAPCRVWSMLHDSSDVCHCSVCRSLQEEEQQLSAKVPLPVNRLIRVQQWLKERSAALEAEKAALDGKQMVSAVNSSSSATAAVLSIQRGLRMQHSSSCVQQQCSADSM